MLFVCHTKPPRQGTVCKKITSQGETLAELNKANMHSIWVSDEAGLRILETAIKAATNFVMTAQSNYGYLFIRSGVHLDTFHFLSAYFAKIYKTPECAMLPIEELLEVLPSQEREERVLASFINAGLEMVSLVFGSLKTISVPMAWFTPSGTGVSPNFNKLAVVDYGDAIQLGEYEASSDAILYEFDVDYRRKVKALRRKEEKGFGPSLRRLRLQKGLTQEDFGHIAGKTIARIELGLVSKPHQETIQKIAKRLGVHPEEIEDY